MERSVKNNILLVAFGIYILIYKLLIFNNFMKYSEIINASFLVILFGVAIKFLGFRKNKPTILSRNILKNVIFYLVVTFVVMYALGAVVGFLKNAYSSSFFVVLDNIFAPIVIIILIELFRYVFVSANKDKKGYLVVLTILLILFEIFTHVRGLSSDPRELFGIIATIILPSIIKNSILTYLTYHIGYQVPILYRLVMDIYGFLVPVVPNLGDYINSIILVSLPVVIYINAFIEIDSKVHKPEPIFNGDNFSVFDIPIVIVLVILVCLISGVFPHYMIGVGSQSMEPYLSKGDAVILRKVPKDRVLKQGDIVAYKKDDIVVIHRIAKVKKSGRSVSYITKGDANNANDSSEVKQSQVNGVVQVKIPFIAYPTVWLSEFLHNK